MTQEELLDLIKANPKNFMLVTVYDGVIAPIVPDRFSALPLPSSRAALRDMQTNDAYSVLVITGRDSALLDALTVGRLLPGEAVRFLNVIAHDGAEILLYDGLRRKRRRVFKPSDEALVFLDARKIDARKFVHRTLSSNGMSFITLEMDSQELMLKRVLELKTFSFVLHTREIKHKLVPPTAASTVASDPDLVPVDERMEALESAFESHIKELLSRPDAPKCVDETGAEVPVFVFEKSAMTFECKPHSALLLKAPSVKTLLDSEKFFSKNCVIFAASDLSGTDGEVAEVIHQLAGERRGVVIQVLDKDRKLYSAENYREDFNPLRQPDLVFESPADFSGFLRSVARLQTDAALSHLAETVSRPSSPLATVGFYAGAGSGVAGETSDQSSVCGLPKTGPV